MKDIPTPQTFANAHIAWLACLFKVLRQIRREGLMSVEGDVENPQAEMGLFRQFPQTQEAPYLEFACDILRLMVAGTLEASDMAVYVEHYLQGLRDGSPAENAPDETLLRTIWLALWASIKGYHPQIALEFARQGVPLKFKPSASALEELLKASIRQENRQRDAGARNGMEAAIERFIASLD